MKNGIFCKFEVCQGGFKSCQNVIRFHVQWFFIYIKRYRCAPELFEKIFEKWGPLVHVGGTLNTAGDCTMMRAFFGISVDHADCIHGSFHSVVYRTIGHENRSTISKTFMIVRHSIN